MLFRSFVPCIHCGVYQTLKFSGLHWDKDEKNELIYDSVHYECESCGGRLEEHDKFALIANGEWRSTSTSANRTAGFHINELYSSWSTWRKIVETWYTDKGNTQTLKTFVNTTLGETWTETANLAMDVDKIGSRIEDYELVPQGVTLLTCAVDTQDDRLEVLTLGWGEGEECWVIDKKVLLGRTVSQEVWDLLESYLQTEFTHESGHKMTLSCTAVDSGGHSTLMVYSFCKKQLALNRRVFAVKGMSGFGRPLIGNTTSNNRMAVPLTMVTSDVGKETLMARLNIEEIDRGYIHLPRWVDTDFLRSLTSEVLEKKFEKDNWKWHWKKIHKRNEMLDCWVYGYSALQMLNPDFAKLRENLKLDIPLEPEPIPQPEVPQQTPRPPTYRLPQRSNGYRVKSW